MKRKIIQAIKQEIKWCIKDKTKDIDPEFKRGFIAGLKQANGIIGSVKLSEK